MYVFILRGYFTQRLHWKFEKKIQPHLFGAELNILVQNGLLGYIL